MSVLRELLAWKWAPLLGLGAGSTSFVVLAILFVPEGVPAPPLATPTAESAPAGEQSRPFETLDAEATDSLGSETLGQWASALLPARGAPEPAQAASSAPERRRGFSPPLQRSAEPPPPAIAAAPRLAPAPPPLGPAVAPPPQPVTPPDGAEEALPVAAPSLALVAPPPALFRSKAFRQSATAAPDSSDSATPPTP